MKHFAHHAHRLLQMKLAVIRYDSRCILPTVLEHNESIIEILDHVSVAGDSKDPAHIRVGWGEKRSSRPPQSLGSRKEPWRCYPRMHFNENFAARKPTATKFKCFPLSYLPVNFFAATQFL